MKTEEIKKLLKVLEENNLFICDKHRDNGGSFEYEPLLFYELIDKLEEVQDE